MAGFFFPGAGRILETIIGIPPIPIPSAQMRLPIFGDLFGILENANNERRDREAAEERLRQQVEAEERQRQQTEAEDRRRQQAEAEERRRIHAEINLERAKMKRQLAEMERKAREDALKHEKQREKTLARLARRANMTRMQGNNIGVFGLTSTGKSTMINSLIGNKVADVGVGETTKEKRSYHGRHCTYWDTPGRNDESTYTNEEYISFIKGLTRRLIVIQYTIRENLKLLRLLDSLGLGYDIIVNKFDDVDDDERRKFRRQIEDEIRLSGLKQMKKIFFLSAQSPKMFPDWLTMVNYLSGPCVDYDQDTDTESSKSSTTSDSD